MRDMRDMRDMRASVLIAHVCIRVYSRISQRTHDEGALRTTPVRSGKTVWKQWFSGHNADYFRAIARRRVIDTSLHMLRCHLR